jgi:hypoxanthine phosphoribosyltransferase
MPGLVPVLQGDAITERIADLAQRISIDYKARDLVMIGVLKGAFIFMADLVRKIEHENLIIDFIRATSYGSSSHSSGYIRILKDIEVNIRNKDVLLVEDILDSGLTASYLLEHFKQHDPKSIKLCAFIDKKERREVALEADYVGHSVDQGFLVGYGLDYAELYRHLPGIYHLELGT